MTAKYLLIFFSFALTIFAQNERGAPIRVACVGDSITAGYALENPTRDAYPVQLARLLGEGWTVKNFGVSGATLMHAGDFPYDRQSAFSAALEWKPEVVIIALGTNDTKESNIVRHPEDFVPSYRSLIARFREANPTATILACLPPPAFPAAMGIDGRVLTARILPLIRDAAAAEKIPLIDLHQPLESAAALFPDKIHPNPEGAARIAEIIYGDAMLATQPRAKAIDPAANTAVIPVPRLEQDSYNWWRRHAEALDQHAKLDPEIVLIGDSITHFWSGLPRGNHRNGPHAWMQTFGERRVLNLGFGWDRTQNVLWRLEHGEFDGIRPKLVVLNIGTNNLSGTENSRVNSPEEIAEGVRAIGDRIQRKCPDAHLLVMGIFPRGRSPLDGYRARISILNTLLAQTLAGRPNTTFLDIGARFLTPDGSIAEEIMPDGLHPSDEGYAIWGQALTETGLLPPNPSARGETNLPALHTGDTVVFIGDSITDGGRAMSGNDYNHTMGQSYAFILAATLGRQLAERNLTFLNRGISGNRIADLQARWKRDVLDLKPNLLSILVGVNDTLWSKGETLEQFEQIYDQLLHDTIAALPNTKIVLGEPFVLPVGKFRDNYATTRTEVEQRQHVVARLAEKYQLPLVHYQRIFDEASRRAPANHWSWDGVHPHYAGHALMADEWLKTVAAAW